MIERYESEASSATTTEERDQKEHLKDCWEARLDAIKDTFDLKQQFTTSSPGGGNIKLSVSQVKQKKARTSKSGGRKKKSD
jgi:hypothetical protein